MLVIYWNRPLPVRFLLKEYVIMTPVDKIPMRPITARIMVFES